MALRKSNTTRRCAGCYGSNMRDHKSLDAWKVRRYLAGVYGEQVFVQWKAPKGLVLGQMKVR